MEKLGSLVEKLGVRKQKDGTLIVKDEWIQGFACACGILGYTGYKSEAQELLKQGGFVREDLIAADVEPIDVERIFGEDHVGR